MTLMEGGGGGGGATEPAPPPPQPRVHAPIARSTIASAYSCLADKAFFVIAFTACICGRGRMPDLLHAEDHPKNKNARGSACLLILLCTLLKPGDLRSCYNSADTIRIPRKTSSMPPIESPRSLLESFPLLHSTLGLLFFLLPLTFLTLAPIIRPWHVPTRFAE